MNTGIRGTGNSTALLLLITAIIAILLSAGSSANGTVSAAGTPFTAVSPRVTGTATPIPPAGQWVAVENEGAVKTWIWQPAESTAVARRTPSPTPIIIIVAPTTCRNDATYLSDVTVPDNTVIGPGQPFEKTWRIENTGSCSWAAGYELAFQAGSRMNAPTHSAVPRTAAGEKADISITMYAPETAGTHTGAWQMVDAQGTPFGQRLTVVIQVPDPSPPTPTPTPLPPPRQFSARLVKWWPNCGSTGLKGTIVEPDGSPVNGLRVRVWADGWDGSLSLVSGVGLTYGPGQWDVLLRQAQTGQFYAEVWDWQTGDNSYVRVDSEVLVLDFNYTQQNCQPDGDGQQWAEVQFVRNY